MDPTIQLRALAEALATARERADLLAKEVWTAEQDYREQHADLLADHELAIAQLKAADSALRTAAADAFFVTGETHPVPGVSIQIRNGVEFDASEALTWAMAQPNWQDYVLLNPVPIKALILTGRAPFGKVVRQPTATIATRLRAALGHGDDLRADILQI